MENQNNENRHEGCESESSGSDFSPSNVTFCNGDCFPTKDSDEKSDTSTVDSKSEESVSAASKSDSSSFEYPSSEEGNAEGSSTSDVKCDNSHESGSPACKSDSDDTSSEILTPESSCACECECGEWRVSTPTSEHSSSSSCRSIFIYYNRLTDDDTAKESTDENEAYNGAVFAYGTEPQNEELPTEDIAATEVDDSIGYANFLQKFTECYGDRLQGSSLEINARKSWKLLHFSERLQYQTGSCDNNKDELQAIDDTNELDISIPESQAFSFEYDGTDPDLFAEDIVFMEVYRNYLFMFRKYYCWFMAGADLLQHALENWYWMTLEERSEFEQEKLKNKKSFNNNETSFKGGVKQQEAKTDKDSLVEISEDEENVEPKAKKARFEELP